MAAWHGKRHSRPCGLGGGSRTSSRRAAGVGDTANVPLFLAASFADSALKIPAFFREESSGPLSALAEGWRALPSPGVQSLPRPLFERSGGRRRAARLANRPRAEIGLLPNRLAA